MRDMVSGLFNHLDASPDRLSAIITGLKQECEELEVEARSLHQRYCLVLIEQYGNDVGIVFIFLMNIVVPGIGSWFLIDAGVPHCYL